MKTMIRPLFLTLLFLSLLFATDCKAQAFSDYYGDYDYKPHTDDAFRQHKSVRLFLPDSIVVETRQEKVCNPNLIPCWPNHGSILQRTYAVVDGELKEINKRVGKLYPEHTEKRVVPEKIEWMDPDRVTWIRD